MCSLPPAHALPRHSAGCRWFHSGGIFASLSPTTSDVVIEGMKAAKAQGAICSFDLNYRAKLWATMGGLEKAQQVGSEIASLCDVLVGNEEDLQLGLVRMPLLYTRFVTCVANFIRRAHM